MADDFAAKVAERVAAYKQRMDLVTRKIVIDVSSSVVKRSPVGNPSLWKNPPPPGYVGGRFRANWMLQQGGIDYTTTETIDASGQASLARVTERLGDDAAGKVWYLSNSLPYARALEYGHSTQAPGGMVRLAAAEFQPIVNRIVAEVRQ